MSRSSLGRVATAWKYARGDSSASRSASHSLAAAPWHLGPCRLRQELYAITVWPQASFSQRATWPPSAAVRQRSIALITFNWSRLTCPRLASRQAGPWSRKISATSRVGRPTSAARTPLVRAAKLRERTLDGSDPTCGHMCVARRRVQLGAQADTRHNAYLLCH